MVTIKVVMIKKNNGTTTPDDFFFLRHLVLIARKVFIFCIQVSRFSLCCTGAWAWAWQEEPEDGSESDQKSGLMTADARLAVDWAWTERDMI